MYYAHSPDTKKNIAAQAYEKHIANVINRAEDAARNVCKYALHDGAVFLQAVLHVAALHDLGKLDDQNQEVLSGKKSAKNLPIQHTDAGAAYFLEEEHSSFWAAIAIQSHHIGYPDFSKETDKDEDMFRDLKVLEHINKTLPCLLERHQSVLNTSLDGSPEEIKGDKSVFLRLLLSCLADADHTDTAIHYGDWTEPKTDLLLRPSERLKKLDEYVASLKAEDVKRANLRTEMYEACRNAEIDTKITSCDSPVGSGKTTAVMAHLLAQAEKLKLRRIFVILPFTNIIKQSVATYREALVLPGENPEEIVAELHHRADVQNFENRHLTALWKALIIVTTSVAFFETLASNSPATLRRLHELPGSAIFVDESHAALPAKLLPLAWKWINIFANEWNCYWVLASGSLCRFWEIKDIINAADNKQIEKQTVSELVGDELRSNLGKYEKQRINYRYEDTPQTAKQIVSWVNKFPGPRLLILNTVQSAAVVADLMAQEFGRHKVEHLSTALCPYDRDKTLEYVKMRLKNKQDTDWTLVATSCVEAGVNLSFRTGFRELGPLISLLQAAGRIDREGLDKNSEIWTFRIVEDGMLKPHPGMKDAALILYGYFERKEKIVPELSTKSIEDELNWKGIPSKLQELMSDESNQNFKKVRDKFKVIDTDTRLTVVNRYTVERIKNHKASWQELQKFSVQIAKYKLTELEIKEILNDIYEWNFGYDNFLGYMTGIIKLKKYEGEGMVI